MSVHEQDSSFYDLFVPLTTKKAIIFITIIGFIVFSNMLFNGFVWDDKTYILFNPDVQSFNFQALLKANLFNAGGQYRPISAIYFASLFAIFGNNTFFYHFLQILLHITNTSLLFIIFTKFFSKKLSFFLSIIFLIHPIQVESVSFIASSDNPLFFLLGISALLLSFKNKISKKSFFLICMLLLLSLLTKEAGILFIAVIFLYKVILKKSGIIPIFIAECLSLLLYFVIRFGIGGVYFTKLPLIPIGRITLFERLIHIPAIIFYYLKTFFFPFQLAIDQQWIIRTTTIQNFYVPLFADIVFFLLVSLFGWYVYKTSKKNFRIYLFFLVWFIIGLFPYLQIFPLDGTVADRWFYVSIAGLLGVLGIGLHGIKIESKGVKILLYTLAVSILFLLSLRTMIRNTNWVDGITLYSNDINTSDNFDIENNLGTEYASVREYKKALEHSRNSVSLFPYEANTYNLANIYEQMGDIKEAKKYYAKALRSPNYLPIHHNHFSVTYIRLASLLYLTDKFADAESVIRRGLQEYPDSGYLWIELSACEYKLHRQDKALAAAKKAKVLLLNTQVDTDSLYNQILENKKIRI